MNRGHSCHAGNVSAGIDRYYNMFQPIPSFQNAKDAQIIHLAINDNIVTEKAVQLKRLDDLIIDIHLKVSLKFITPDVALIFYDKELRGVAEYFNEKSPLVNNSGILKLRFVFKRILFSKGVYSLSIAVKSHRKGEILLRAQSVAHFQVISECNVWTALQLEGDLIQHK
jgi:hypothetical protein